MQEKALIPLRCRAKKVSSISKDLAASNQECAALRREIDEMRRARDDAQAQLARSDERRTALLDTVALQTAKKLSAEEQVHQMAVDLEARSKEYAQACSLASDNARQLKKLCTQRDAALAETATECAAHTATEGGSQIRPTHDLHDRAQGG